MKIYFTYDKKQREGYHTRDLNLTRADEVYNGDVEEIAGENVLEKVPNLIEFIEECYRLLEKGKSATFTASYYDSWQAYQDPRNVRQLSQASLNFADKTWREQNGCPDLADCDFQVACDFAIDLAATQRSDAAKEFWLNRYKNVVQSIKFTLTKR